MDALRKEQKDNEKVEGLDEAEEITPQKPKGRRLGKFILWLILLTVVVLGFLSWWSGMGLFSSDYQAVFLVNGQVYFGKVASRLNASFMTLKDVYYLQINQQLQPVEEGQPQQPEQPQFLLVKLGTQEIHGPKDEMYINRDQISFVEDLRSDSQVIQAIKQFRASQ